MPRSLVLLLLMACSGGGDAPSTDDTAGAGGGGDDTSADTGADTDTPHAEAIAALQQAVAADLQRASASRRVRRGLGGW